MAVTEEQAFRIGFLAACAEAGLTPEETLQRVKTAAATLGAVAHNAAEHTKTAFNPVSSLINATSRGLGALPGLARTALVYGVGLPIIAGGAGGYTLAKMQEPDASADVETTKQRELVDEYERLAEEARKRTLLKRIQKRTGRDIIPLGPSLSM